MSTTKNTGRTVTLSLVVAVLLIVLAVVAVLIVRDNKSPDESAATADVPSSTTSTTKSTTTRSTPSTTSSSRPSTHTRPTGEPGTVTYQFTGNGEVVGAAYRSGTQMKVVVITSTPWQQRTTVPDQRAELTGIVIRGPITCTIMQGEELLASSTSNGGPISCSTRLPR